MDMQYFNNLEAAIPTGTVRTRFAPSPTGYMHVGGLRTALYAYLTAKKAGGQFILRIEDTDQGRYVEGATEIIYDTLLSSGLIYDEGPDIGGPVGPYVQTERRDIYTKYAELLLENGGAYRCFCSHDEASESRLGNERRECPCRSMSQSEISDRLSENAPFVIRQRIPLEGTTTFSDAVFGEITVENASLDDNVLIKSDGLPTYNFANVIDDHLMGITHIIRGSEYLSSTPKYDLLYKSYGWEIPSYIHCSPVMKDAQNKLSKRKGDPTYNDLLDMGFLKEAVLNYVALLGWSPGGEREVFSLSEMVDVFDISGISKSPAIFDKTKLMWFNTEYIKAMSPEAFHELALPYIQKAITKNNIDTLEVAKLVQPRCEILTDIPERIDFLDALPEYDSSLYVHKKMKTDEAVSLEMLKASYPVFESLSLWTEQSVHDALFKLVESLGVKNGQLLWPLRVALSGKLSTPGGAVEIAFLLGREETLARLKQAVEKLS